MEKQSNKFWYVTIGAGAVIVILVVVLMIMLFREVDSGGRWVSVPEEEFVYDPEAEYGEVLKFSSEMDSIALDGLSGVAYDEITKRISAFFAENYPEYESFGLVKDSYKKTEKDANTTVGFKMVSNVGTIVGVEITDEIKDYIVDKTTVRVLTSTGEEAYKTVINWEELDV